MADIVRDIKALEAIIGASYRDFAEDGDYCMYENDDPESGVIVFYNKRGVAKMWMPAESYFKLKEKLEAWR